jgi:hypothetical protein
MLSKQTNMQVSKRAMRLSIIAVVVAIALTGCKRKITEDVIYDNVIYQVDDVAVYDSNVDKVKQKTATQYISILYSDLFNTNISNNELSEISELYLANGDKGLANELLISHYLISPSVVVPTDATMRADLDLFVGATYLRFYQRNPTPYEMHYLKELIANDVDLNPETVYTSFALSNEYQFY